MSAVPVVIVGAGPTGLTAATLLGQYGVECLVLDRWESVYPQPRAVHLDDEIYRVLARMGVAEQFAAITRACHGLRLLDRNMRVLAEFRRGTATGPHGYPEANMFDQPVLEQILRANLRRYETVTIRGNVEVTGIDQDGAGRVRLEVTDRVCGRSDSILAEYVLGCDGANSLTRATIGACLQDLHLEQRWLVVDVDTDADLAEWEGVHQLCDPRRAGTYMRVGPTRYRWEFRLRPGEVADDFRDPAWLHPLISPWTKDIPVDRLQLVRVAEYTFRARLADRWRDGQVFLLGDAAHLTPPFIGQGMGAGMRDAANLAWKLAGVLDGTLPERVLDTYQAERKPHARALIRLATFVGIAMTEGGDLGNLLRRMVAPRLRLVPGVSRLVLSSETPALHGGELADRRRLGRFLGRSLTGRLCPNAVLEDGRRFDDTARGRFAVVTTADASPEQRAAVEGRGGVLVCARPGTPLHRWLRRGHATTAIVRPDATVLRAGRDLPALCEALPHFAPHRRPATAGAPQPQVHPRIAEGVPGAAVEGAAVQE
jgi:3-(3-hydroxy-phenyl)propionate hydroxylase